jgi:hypothetical protein
LSGSTANDSSGNGYNGTVSSSGVTYSQAGAIVGDTDTSMLFSSTAQLALPYTLNPSTWTALSLEYWIKLSSGWQYVVVTASNTTGVTTLYLNGSVYTSGTGDFIGIDTDIYYAGSPASGNLDEVALYNYVLTPSQIFRHYLQQISSGGFALCANGTGTVSFDHFRVTQYPDPALSLAAITPRVGNTSVLWNANVPSNTTLGVDISTDGVNWIDVTSSNGGNLPGIFSQPDPTSDGFGTNTLANYINTFRTGGAAATVTYDTANSRISLTGGANGVYVNSSIIRSDIDFFADLDQSDAGGLVWRFVDQSNFYYLSITDGQATSSPNTITLYKVANNVRTQLGTTALTYNVGPTTNYYTVRFTRGTFRRFRVTMFGSVITCYVDGVQLLTYTDSSPLGAGKVGLFNNGGIIGSRYYQLWIVQIGDYVSGTPALDLVTSTFIYTQQRLSTTTPIATPQISDITTLATTPEIGVGDIIPRIAYNASFLNKNFDDLTKSGDYTWFINSNKRFNFRANGTTAAPWILQSAPSNLVANVDLEVDNNLELDVGNDLYRNRMTILGVQGTTIQTATFMGNGSTTSFTLGYPLASAPIIILNGITQIIGLKGATGAQWYYALDDAVIQQDTSQNTLEDTDELFVSYTGLFDESITVDDISQQSAFALIEGGSGIVEAVEDHSSDNPRMKEDQAIAYAQGLINRYAIAGRTFIFDTSRDGLAVGMTLSIFLPEHGVWDGQFLITQIEITLKKAVGDEQVWWYKVTASELPRQASWAKLLATGIGLR